MHRANKKITNKDAPINKYVYHDFQGRGGMVAGGIGTNSSIRQCPSMESRYKRILVHWFHKSVYFFRSG